jgi:hypothetical protein
MAPWIFWEIASLGIVSLFIAQLIAQQQPHSTERLAVQFLLWNADFLAGLRKKYSQPPTKIIFPVRRIISTSPSEGKWLPFMCPINCSDADSGRSGCFPTSLVAS